MAGRCDKCFLPKQTDMMGVYTAAGVDLELCFKCKREIEGVAAFMAYHGVGIVDGTGRYMGPLWGGLVVQVEPVVRAAAPAAAAADVFQAATQQNPNQYQLPNELMPVDGALEPIPPRYAPEFDQGLRDSSAGG
jgi:hypothetical protein